MTEAQKPHFENSKQAVKWYVMRAKLAHDVSRAEIAAAMGVGPNYVTMLTGDKYPCGPSLPQIKPFARATRMSHGETMRLALRRIEELDGQKAEIDASLIKELILTVRNIPDKSAA